MSLAFYMDVNVRRALTEALRLRGVDVLTAQEDGAAELPDAQLLDRTTALGRVLFTHDRDFLRETARRRKLSIWKAAEGRCSLCGSASPRLCVDLLHFAALHHFARPSKEALNLPPTTAPRESTKSLVRLNLPLANWQLTPDP